MSPCEFDGAKWRREGISDPKRLVWCPATTWNKSLLLNRREHPKLGQSLTVSIGEKKALQTGLRRRAVRVRRAAVRPAQAKFGWDTLLRKDGDNGRATSQNAIG